MRLRSKKQVLEGYLFISPWLIGFLLFTFGPILASLFLSFTKYDLMNPPKWVGLGNFRELMNDPLFRRSLINTLYYTVVVVPCGMVFSLSLALLLNTKIKGIYIFRAIYYLPTVTSGVALCLLWRWLFNPDFGLVNYIISKLGFTPPGWLTDPVWAMPVVMSLSIWAGVGGPMLIYLAGLQNIPEQLYEAAALDGANAWQQFKNITIPMLSPTIFFNLVMAIISSFQVFTTVYVMTSYIATATEPGGPANSTLVYVLYLYQTGFRYLTMGKACAMAWILFLIIFTLTLINFKLAPKWVHYEQI